MVSAKTAMTVLDARTGKYDDGNRLPGAKALAPDATEAQVTAMLPGGPLMRCGMSKAELSPLILTVGHSTHALDDFVRLLQAHGATCVGDVRTVPRSRHNPQFNQDALPVSLKRAGVGYVHLPGLGGLRHVKAGSLNTGWRNASFRGYADYMQTPEFAESLEELIRLAAKERVVLTCAESVPWRCHRSLIADALLVRGSRVEHIMTATHRQAHALTPFAKVRGIEITYPEAVPAAGSAASPVDKRV